MLLLQAMNAFLAGVHPIRVLCDISWPCFKPLACHVICVGMCSKCGRKFAPDRIDRHESTCRVNPSSSRFFFVCAADSSSLERGTDDYVLLASEFYGNAAPIQTLLLPGGMPTTQEPRLQQPPVRVVFPTVFVCAHPIPHSLLMCAARCCLPVLSLQLQYRFHCEGLFWGEWGGRFQRLGPVCKVWTQVLSRPY